MRSQAERTTGPRKEVPEDLLFTRLVDEDGFDHLSFAEGKVRVGWPGAAERLTLCGQTSRRTGLWAQSRTLCEDCKEALA